MPFLPMDEHPQAKKAADRRVSAYPGGREIGARRANRHGTKSWRFGSDVRQAGREKSSPQVKRGEMKADHPWAGVRTTSTRRSTMAYQQSSHRLGLQC